VRVHNYVLKVAWHLRDFIIWLLSTHWQNHQQGTRNITVTQETTTKPTIAVSSVPLNKSYHTTTWSGGSQEALWGKITR